jgi:ABC-type multidrug transport system ATPase subunit
MALDDISVDLARGELVALVGANGAGKSTLLQLAVGLLEPTSGDVLVEGSAAGSLDARRSLSYISDQPSLYDDLTVNEHIEYVSRLHGGPARPESADELLDLLNLTPRADDLPARFSRGLRQKTSIAIGLIRPFELLLVDEPFVGLDAPGKVSLLELLDEANADGAAIVVATHDPQYVERVDRCIALRDGEVIHDGRATPTDVLRLVGA